MRRRWFLAAEIGVIAAPGAAGVGEDQDALVVIHEGGGLGKIRRSRADLDAEAVTALAGGRCAASGR